MIVDKSTKLYIGVALVLVIVVGFVLFQSSLNERKALTIEILKSQLQEKYGEDAETLIEDTQVQRSWFSFHPNDWTYDVTFSDGRGQHSFSYQCGIFTDSMENNLCD